MSAFSAKPRAGATSSLDTIFVRYYEKHAIRTRSAEANRYALRHCSEFFAGKVVTDLTPANQEAFVQHLADKGLAAGYIRRIFTILRAALNWAYKRQEISESRFIEMPPKGEQRERILSQEECAALFNAVEEDHVFMFLMLAFNTLARPEALLQLKRFQVDLGKRLVHLNPPGRKQTKKFRPTVPMSGTLMPWLRECRAEDIVSWHGRPIKSIKTAFRATRRRAGLSSDVVTYTIRHTMATELRRRGVPMWEVQGMLGHKTGRTTEIYAKYDPNYLSEAVRAIDEFFKELQPMVNRALVLGEPELRASCVLVEGGGKT